MFCKSNDIGNSVYEIYNIEMLIYKIAGVNLSHLILKVS